MQPVTGSLSPLLAVAVVVTAAIASSAMLAVPGAGTAYAAGTDDFVTTWKTDSANESITIPVGGATGNYTVDWGDNDTSTHTTDATHTYTAAGTYTVRISGDFTRIMLGADGDNADKLQTIQQWGNASWTSMGEAFEAAEYMTYTATDAPDLSGVTNMSHMFHGVLDFKPTTLNSWNVSTVTDMSYMLAGIDFNGNISSWNVSSVTDMNHMFAGSTLFNQPLDSWDVSSVTDMSFMFNTADAFNQPLDSWDVSSVTDMESMFDDADAFNQPLGSWNVSSVTDMSNMFRFTAFSQNLGNWYIVPGDTEVDSDDKTVTTIAAQNSVLDGHNPTYSVQSGGDGDQFTVDTKTLKFTGASYDKTSYNITITSTGTFGTSNSRDITVTVTGVNSTYSSSKADTVDSIEVAVTGNVTGTPRAADFSVKVGTANPYALSTALSIVNGSAGSTITLSLPSTGLISSGDAVRLNYTQNTGFQSNLAAFTNETVTNNVFAGPGSFTATAAPTSMALSWSEVSNAPSGSKYFVQYKLGTDTDWNTAVDKGTSGTSHTFTGLTASTDYDFRVWLEDSAGDRISDYSTSDTATAAPAYSSSKADTVDSIEITTTGSVTGIPRAADFSVQVGSSADYYSLSTPPTVSGTTVTLTLPSTGLISNGDAVKVNYTKVTGSTSDLATFAPQSVTNNVFAGPGSFTATAAPTSMALSWSAVSNPPANSKYFVQHKLDTDTTWNTAVDKGTSGTSHTFTGLTASTDYDFRVWLEDSAGDRISDYSTSDTATAAPAYSSSKADTVDSIEITTTGSVTGIPRAADFSVQVGSSADYYSLSTPPTVSGTTVTLTLPSTGLISNGDAVKVNYTKVTGSTSDLATFAPQSVTNNVFAGPGSFTATAAPTSMALSWSAVPSAPSGSKYFVQHKLDTDTTWNTAVDKGTSGTSHTFTGLTASTDYDFRVWLEDSAGDRISDYSTSDTATAAPAYSSSKADTVDSIEITTTGSVTGIPRAADFSVQVGSSADYYSLSTPPTVSGTTVTLTLPSTGLISNGDAVKVNYTKVTGSTSDLATFAPQSVTNNVFAGPGSFTATAAPTSMALSWSAVSNPPANSKYFVQHKLDTDTTWNTAVDKGTSGTSHTFTGLTASTDYDFRVWLEDSAGDRISDYSTSDTATAAPAYSSSKADTVDSIEITTTGSVTGIPRAADFSVQVGSSADYYSLSTPPTVSGTTVTLTLPSTGLISNGDAVKVNYTKVTGSTSDLATFAPQSVTNNVFAGPGSFTATAAPTSMALSWSAVSNPPANSKYFVQHKLNSTDTWNTAVDKGTGTSHTFTGLTASTLYDFRVWLEDSAGDRISDYSASETATSNPAYLASTAGTVDSIAISVVGSVTGTPRAADFSVKVGAADPYTLSTDPNINRGGLTIITLSLPSTSLISNGDTVKINYTRNMGYQSDLAEFTNKTVTNQVYAAPGSFTATAAPTSMALSWSAVSNPPAHSKYFVQHKLNSTDTWNTAVDKGTSGTSHTFTGLTASTLYDFRVWLEDSAGSRISDYSASETATSNPAYSSSKADTVDSIEITTTGSVTGIPRAADFSVQVGSSADYYSLSTPPTVSGTTVTLTLPSTGLISNGDAVKVNYTKVTGSTSDLATFAPQSVTNNVFAGPGSFTATAAPTSMALSWSAVSNPPANSKYFVQHKLDTDTTWNTAVDKGTSGTSHTFTGLTASTDYDFRVWLEDSAGDRISDYSTSDTATAAPAYSSSKADTVDSIEITTTGSVTGIPRAADFSVQVGSSADYYSLSTPPTVSGTTVTLTLPSTGLISNGDAVKVNYTKVTGSTSDLATFAPQSVTNNVFAGPGSFTATAAPTSMALSWSAVSNPPANSKYFVQHKLDTDTTWNTAVDKGTSGTSHTFTGLTASTDYDFRVWLEDSAGDRISDYSTSDTATAAPAYSSSKADTVDSIEITTTGSVTGIPRAADFSVQVGSSADYYSLSTPPTVSGTTVTLTLPSTGLISNGDAVKVNYTKVTGSTSDLATFAPQSVTNNVFAGPGSFTATAAPTSMALSWSAVSNPPANSKYFVQHKLDTDTTWNTAVDKGTSGTSHTFTGLTASTDYDFRVWLEDSAGDRISDYSTSDTATAAPAYSSSKADTVDSIEITTTGSVTGIPRAADFSVQVGSSADYYSLSTPPTVSGTTVTLTLPSTGLISNGDAVKVNYTKVTGSTSDLATFAPQSVTNNVFAGPGSFTATAAPTSMALSWSAVSNPPANSKYFVQHKLDTDTTWNTAVDKGTSGTSHTFTGLTASTDYDFRVWLEDSAGDRISDYSTSDTATAAPAYSSSKADTVDSIEITTTGSVTGIPRAADFSVQVGSSADYYSLSTPPTVSGTTVTLTLPSTGLISNGDAVKVNYTKVTGSTSDLATFAPQSVTNNVFAGPGSFTATAAPTYMLLEWTAVPSAPSGSEYRVQSKLNSTGTWGTAVDKNSLLTHNFTGLTASTDYDFRVYLVDSAGDRISDYSTSFTATAAPAYSSSKADTVDSIVITTNGSVTNTPRAADFSVQVGTADYYSLSTAPVVSGTTVTLTLPNTGLIYSGTAVKVNYTKVTGSTSDLATFTPQAVTNNVFAKPGSFTTTAAPTFMLLEWTAVPSAPSGSEYRVQSKLNSTSTWGTAVDRDSMLTHNFTGLTASTNYDFRVYLVNSAGARISDYSTSFTATAAPAYSSSKADTVDSIVITTNGSVTNTPRAADFSVQVGASADYYSLSTAPVVSGTTITLSLPSTGLISNGDAVKVNYTKVTGSTSDLATFTPQSVTNNVFAGPGSFTATAAPTYMLLEWTAVPSAPSGSEYRVQSKLNSTSTWGTAVDKNSLLTHNFTGLTASTDYDFRVYLVDSAGDRISDYSTSFTATAAPAYSSSKADTVDSIVITTNGSVTNTPRAADFSVQVGTADYYSLSTAPVVSGTTITLSLPSTGLISNGDAVKVNYTKVTGSTSDLATFTPQAVTNNVFVGPGSFTAIPAPTSMALTWSVVSNPPANSKYFVQYKLDTDTTWNTAVDKGTSGTSHTFTGLTASTDYDFRVWLANSGNARISDYSTSDTATSNPAYSSSKADTVDSIELTVTGNVTGTPRAADFEVKVGSADYYSLSATPSIVNGSTGSTLTLSLPSTGLISNGDTVKVKYTRNDGYTSDLAAFTEQTVTNNVFAAPGGGSITTTPVTVNFAWTAVPSAPSGSKYYVQYKLGTDTTWNAAVDKGTSGTNHTFTGLTAATSYDFRAYLAEASGTRISDYRAVTSSTSVPMYSSSRADTVDTVTITTVGIPNQEPWRPNFGVQIGSSGFFAPASLSHSGTTIVLTLPSDKPISNGDTVQVQFDNSRHLVSNLAAFSAKAVTNNVFAGPGSFTATPAPTSMALTWSVVSNPPANSKYFVQYKLDTDTTWNTAVDKGTSGTSHTFTGLTASTDYDFRVWLANSGNARISDYSTSDTATSNPAYSSSKADTVDSIELTVTGNVTGTPRAADFEVKVGSAAYYPLSATPSLAHGPTGSTVTLSLPSTGLISNGDTVKVKYTRNGGYTSDLAAFTEQTVTNNVFVGPGSFTATPAPTSMALAWSAVPSAPSGSKYYVQHKLDTANTWNTAVDKGTSGTSHTFTGLTASTDYDFRVWLANSGNARIGDYSTSDTATSNPAYSSSKADTVDSIELTVTGNVTGTPRAADFEVKVGSAAYYPLSATPSLAHGPTGSTVTLSLPSTGLISNGDTVKVKYTRNGGYTSDLAAFTEQTVTNNVFVGPGSFTATPAPTSMALAWSAVPSAPSGSKYYVQHKLDTANTWNTAVDKGTSGTSHTFTDLTASTDYDFRVWLANAAGSRIGDYSTSDTATSNPAYSSSAAVAVSAINVTTVGSVTGTPRAADFSVKIGTAAPFALSGTVTVEGTTVALTLPSDKIIGSGDTVKINYTRNTGYQSDLAAFTDQTVVNRVLAAPSGIATSSAHDRMTVSWDAVVGAPSGSKYYTQYKLNTSNTWNDAVDKGTARTHTFTGLVASTVYDFRVWLADSGNTRITDYGNVTAATVPTYSAARADTANTVTLTTTGAIFGLPRAQDFGVTIGQSSTPAVPTGIASVNNTATATLTLSEADSIPSGANVTIRHTSVPDSTSDLATFPDRPVTNNVLAAPGGIATSPTATSMAVSWNAVPGAPQGSKYLIQHKLGTDSAWGAAVDRGSATSYTYTGLTSSAIHDFRAYLADSAGARLGDYAVASRSTDPISLPSQPPPPPSTPPTPAPAYSSAAADTVRTVTVTTTAPVTGVPRAVDFGIGISGAPHVAPAGSPAVSGTAITLTLPAGTTMSSSDALTVAYTRVAQSTSNLEAFAASPVTNNVFAAPGTITSTPISESVVAVSWAAVPGAPPGSKYLVQYKLGNATSWNTAVDKGTGTSHAFAGLVSGSDAYDFRVYLAQGGGVRISDYGTTGIAPAAPAYSAATAHTVGTVTVTTTAPVTGVPRAADFGIGISGAPHVAPAGTPTVSGTAITLTLPAGIAIAHGDAVLLSYAQNPGYASDLVAFTDRDVTNSVLPAPGNVTAAVNGTAPTTVALSWSAVPSAPPGSKYLVQYKPSAEAAWNSPAVDRGTAGTSHAFAGLSASAGYDFRVWLADTTGDARISDYGAATTATVAHSSAAADTVGTVTLVTNATLTGTPRAADFGISVSGAPAVAPAGAPATAAAANGTAITLSLPANTTISSTDTVRLSYAQNSGYTSNLAPFTGLAVANNVLPAPGNVTAAAGTAPTMATLSWSTVPSAPAGSKYYVQHKQGTDAGWDSSPAVDKGPAGTSHTFGSLSPSTQYDFRVWLADTTGDARISDYGTASNSTAPLQPPSTGATVAGNAFEDADRDGLPGAGERGLPGITVLVYDYILGVPHRVQTGADGGYTVTNVTFGQTALSQIVLPLPAGYLPTGGIFDLVSYTPLLTAAAPSATVDFPLYRVPATDLGTVTFDVFDDADGDGERDAGEPGVPGATVFTFELLTFEADVQVTGDSGATTHPNLIPDVVLAQISYSDPSTGELLLPDGFTRITTPNGGAEYLTLKPGAAHTVRIGLGR